MNSPPKELESLAQVIARYWDGGSFSFKAVLDDGVWHLVAYPSLREIVGGEHDGGVIFSRFSINISKLMRKFDKPPKVIFDSATGYMVPLIFMDGFLGGTRYRVTFFSVPPPDSDVSEVYHSQGPKKGTVEPKQFEDDDDE